MSRTAKSQWDFGELFPAESLRRVWSVGELTSSIKRALEKEIGQIWVTGEISNLRIQASGHVYFCLKDHHAQLNCVLFRGDARAVNRELLKDGQKVVLQGELTVYEPRGQYQLRVTAVEMQGVGALQAAFERLKQKLAAEGLFDSERKRSLPKYPERIGLVTSPTGAAIRDVLHVIQRRNPCLQIVLAGCRVQGQGAADEIAGCIRWLNRWADSAVSERRVDLILLTRGGGSLEDLWAFNEETVARAIYESRLPVISAVGHEIDFTISDFVADVRAATPSVAAELITEGFFASREFIVWAPRQLSKIVRDRCAREFEALERIKQRLERSHPRRRLQAQWQRLDDLQTGLSRSLRYRYRSGLAAWMGLAQRLMRMKPSMALGRRREALAELQCRLVERPKWHLERYQSRLAHANAKLRLLSPQNVLERGYSITTDAISGRVIRRAKDAEPGQTLATRLQEGIVRSVVEDAKIQGPGSSFTGRDQSGQRGI